MKITETEFEVELEHHALDYQKAEAFWQQVTKYHDLGYKVKRNMPLPYLTFAPIVRVCLTKAPAKLIQEGEDKVAAANALKQAIMDTTEDIDKLDDLSKKGELLNFAERRDIAVSKDKQNPSAIKKFLKEIFVNKIDELESRKG